MRSYREPTADGPTPRQLFDLKNVALETGVLLASSFACGMASIAVGRKSQLGAQVALLVTGLLGLVFLLLEIQEFAGLIARGAGLPAAPFSRHSLRSSAATGCTSP